MAYTPSYGIDQNQDGKFIDKYYGSLPQFLKFLPESYMCEVNPEYVRLFYAYRRDEINADNISDTLRMELDRLILNFDCPCLLSGAERSVVQAIIYFYDNGNLDGYTGCPMPSSTLDCGDSLCCNTLVMCSPESICPEEGGGGVCTTGFSEYNILVTHKADVPIVNAVPGASVVSEDGAVIGSYGSITLLSGIDLGLTGFYTITAAGTVGNDTTYYVAFDSNCVAQTSVEVEFSLPYAPTILLTEVVVDNSAELFVASSDGLSGYIDTTIKIRVRRNGCDQCNLVVPPPVPPPPIQPSL